MNKRQKIVIIIMGVADFMMFLFPPFIKYQSFNDKNGLNAGYKFIFTSYYSSINTTVLFVQFFIVTFLSALIFYLLKNKKHSDDDTDRNIKIFINALVEGDEEVASSSFKKLVDK